MNNMPVANRRLTAMLETIALERERETEPTDDLTARRAEIAKAADLLVRFYGSDALARAKVLEERPGAGSFAKWVRIYLERRGSGTADASS